ncbi:MAG: type IVB secretion system protein IcmV [Gammaproteobacteria bacterium]|nr:type IVB secretion system protein IcmV [Gammaproteobacteria bacterium]
MGLGKSLKKGISSGFKVKRWIDSDNLKSNGLLIVRLWKSIFRVKKEKPIRETFEQARARMNLTDEDLAKRVRLGFCTVWFCLGLAFALCIYMFYLFSHTQIMAGLVCLMLMLTMLAYAYREHFNIFQIKQRRLGCTFKQWVQYISKKGSK